ncbi:MAG TPA: gluconate 2-dehydrogenase subunit 3 family protein [Vicinamibacterales bacterium]|nr:gluconate 2-dehydrogenase subunit 3 family protein [Vicinamibacterales bacterium]
MGTSETDLNRRRALTQLVAGSVGIVSMPLWVESICARARAEAHTHAAQAAASAPAWTPSVLTPHQNEAVIALTELIIPATDTPGAKAALVNRFVDHVLSTTDAKQRAEFIRGLTWLDDRCRARTGKDIAGASAAELTTVLTPLAAEGKPAADDAPGVAFFRAIKSMTITGYYTSEIGLRQELGDDGRMMLGAFEGCTHPEHQ